MFLWSKSETKSKTSIRFHKHIKNWTNKQTQTYKIRTYHNKSIKMFSYKHFHYRKSRSFGQQLNRLNMEGTKNFKGRQKEVL